MRIPVDESKVQIIVIGLPTPTIDFTSKAPKFDGNGVPLFRVPVVLSGTGERMDPTVVITVASATPPSVKSGDVLVATNLVANTWSMRDDAGRERSGVSFRADRLEVHAKQAR
jgi:hypothetical protein